MSPVYPSTLSTGRGQPGLRDPNEVKCIHCGYMLRGLHARGTCPECGTPIFRSLQGDSLEHADGHWLKLLRYGTSTLFWYAILAIIAGFLSGGFGSSASQATPSYTGTDLFFLGLTILLEVMWLAGIFLMTTGEPRAVSEESPFALRYLIRYGAAFVFVSQFVSLAVASQNQIAPSTALIVVFLILANGIARLAVYFGLGMIYRRLAIRMEDYDLAAHTRTAVWGLMASYGLMVLTVAMTDWLGRQGAIGGAAGVFFCGGVIAFLAVVGFGIWMIRLLRQYEYALFAAEQKASRPVTTPPPPPPAPE